ncbi:MAG: hypothetical protein NXI31_19970 [bacterium]|nr:hypothetical protein [bacterium]
MQHEPDRQSCRRILEMLATGLVSSKHLQPWAVGLVEQLDTPPSWLRELATVTYLGDVKQCLRDHVLTPPLEDFDQEQLTDYHVACLLYRYDRRELSWATTLSSAGLHTDGNDASEPCEYFYDLLNELEDNENDAFVEQSQVAIVRQRFATELTLVQRDFEPLRAAFRRGIAEGLRASRTPPRSTLPNWTESDFGELGWHDCRVHGWSIAEAQHGQATLTLDLDYITQWEQPVDGRYTFHVAPATLVFFEVFGLTMTLDYEGSAGGAFAIEGIEREERVNAAGYRDYLYTIRIHDPPTGSIQFEGNRFRQVLRASPIRTTNQYLDPAVRAPLIQRATDT